MKKHIALYYLVILLAISCLTGCGSEDHPSDMMTIDSINDVLMFKGYDVKAGSKRSISSIYEGITLGELLKLFGTPLRDTRNAFIPIAYTWSVNEEEQVLVFFDSTDFLTFMEKLKSCEFVLPNEELVYVEGSRLLTDNEKKLLKECFTNLKAYEAEVIKGGKQTEILFGDQVQ